MVNSNLKQGLDITLVSSGDFSPSSFPHSLHSLFSSLLYLYSSLFHYTHISFHAHSPSSTTHNVDHRGLVPREPDFGLPADISGHQKDTSLWAARGRPRICQSHRLGFTRTAGRRYRPVHRHITNSGRCHRRLVRRYYRTASVFVQET